MALFIFLLALAAIGVAGIVTAVVLDKDGEVYRWPFAVFGPLLIVVAGLSILFGQMWTTVGTSEVGITTSFGHVDGDLTPGVHLVAPWKDVTIWDDSVQQSSFTGKNCLEIRIAGQQSACLDVNVFWKVKPSGADSQFREYRTFSRMGNAYFSRAVITQYYNNVFETFNPVNLVSETNAGQRGGVTVSTLTDQVRTSMRAAYAGVADILSLSSGQIAYDPQVESALSAVVKAKANTNVAAQNEQTAQDQRIADQAEQNDLTGPVVEQNCINVTQQMEQAGDTLPQGWSCTSGSGVSILAGSHS
jgi:regulator of protease activity HflC (stomatin/prohibitin superfamily)